MYLLILFLIFTYYSASAEQYFNTYYSYELQDFVYCIGNPQIKPVCFRTSDPSKQLYSEVTYEPIEYPEFTGLGIEHDSLSSFLNTQDNDHTNWTNFVPIFDKFLVKNISSGQAFELAAPNSQVAVIKNLVLLLRFPEHQSRSLFTRSDYNVLLNGAGFTPIDIIPTGSVKHYYSKQSYGKLIIESTVTPWIDTMITEEEATNGCSALCTTALLREAITRALEHLDQNNIINFADFDSNNDGHIDAFTVITSSMGAESGAFDDRNKGTPNRVWSHKWGLARSFTSKNGIFVNRYNVNPALFGVNPAAKLITRIGVLVHEIGHFLGLPDLYDTTASSSGLHVYSVMSSSWGIKGSQQRPCNFDPWSKEKLGVINLKPVQVGRNLIRPSNLNSDNQIYVLDSRHGLPANEKIYIDFQINIEASADHPPGILIYHADNNVTTGNRNAWWPGNGKLPGRDDHYLVRLIQADSLYRLEKEPWPKRYDPDVYFPSLSTIELKDIPGELLPYTEMNKAFADCKRPGNRLYNFKKLNDQEYEFYYQKLGESPCTSTLTTLSPTTTIAPTIKPTLNPTIKLTNYPTTFPTRKPTPLPTAKPTPGICDTKVGYNEAINICATQNKKVCTKLEFLALAPDQQTCPNRKVFWVEKPLNPVCLDPKQTVYNANTDKIIACQVVTETQYVQCC